MSTIDLTSVSGLPLSLDPDTGLLAGLDDKLLLEEPGRRRFGDLRTVVAQPGAIDSIADDVAYLTYRDVRVAEETKLAASGLRYDVTVTLPGTVAGEYVKTAGHYHGLDGNGVSWPEIYDVLFGSAVFVLQQAVGDPAGDPAVTRGVAIVAKTGDRLVIPPDFGHVTVNVGATPLVVADLVAATTVNHYQGYVARRGGAVRVLVENQAPFETVWNPMYPPVDAGIELIRADALPPFEAGTPLYKLGVGSPELVAFLTDPRKKTFRI